MDSDILYKALLSIALAVQELQRINTVPSKPNVVRLAITFASGMENPPTRSQIQQALTVPLIQLLEG